MNISGLSFNALPPIDLPFRYFLTAPLFVIFCGIYLLSYGDSLWLSRWTTGMLTLTHAFTLGFISMVMMGALLQLLPVIGGVGIKKPRFIATTCHMLHCVGTCSLLLAFNAPTLWWLYLAIFCLTLSFLIYIVALIQVLIKKLSQGDSVIGFRLAVFSLMVVVLLGLGLLSRNVDLTPFGLSQLTLLADKHFTNIHAVWGIAGWGSLLIIAVSFQVIPMFHVAPSFPAIIKKTMTWFVMLFLFSYIFFPVWAMSLLFVVHAIFAFSLLSVLARRKRRIIDTTIRYWQFAAIALLLSNAIYFFPESWLMLTNDASIFHNFAHKKELILAAIIIFGYLVSVIQGMLLKILPFLSYTHLQQRCLMDFSAMQYIPNMHEFFTKRQASILFYLHCTSSVLLLAVILENQFYHFFAVSLIIEFLYLFFLSLKTVLLYFQVSNKISLSSKG